MVNQNLNSNNSSIKSVWYFFGLAFFKTFFWYLVGAIFCHSELLCSNMACICFLVAVLVFLLIKPGCCTWDFLYLELF